MNYIKKLESERNELREKSQTVEMAINNFIAHLHSPKFQGVESNGERKDWIATGDVLNFLIELRGQNNVPAKVF